VPVATALYTVEALLPVRFIMGLDFATEQSRNVILLPGLDRLPVRRRIT